MITKFRNVQAAAMAALLVASQGQAMAFDLKSFAALADHASRTGALVIVVNGGAADTTGPSDYAQDGSETADETRTPEGFISYCGFVAGNASAARCDTDNGTESED